MELRTKTETAQPRAPAGARPAFYALRSGGWRDYLTLLHPPYTLWHLSYVALGAALSPTLQYDHLAAAMLAFFLALGIGAHALDELQGRPLRTQIPGRALVALAVFGMAGAVGLGVLGVFHTSPWLLIFIAFGVFIAPAYNLEWFGGRFHNDFWFAAAWGVFPFLTGYWVVSESIGPAAGAGAVAVFLLSLAQRTLSRRVRNLRRQARAIEGRIVLNDGSVQDIDRHWLVEPEERALTLMTGMIVALAAAALVAG